MQAKIVTEKNEPTWLYSVLIKKKMLIVLRLMVTRYIGNMIVFLRCHYAHLFNHSSSVHMFAIKNANRNWFLYLVILIKRLKLKLRR